jgi:hypothetical protein
VNRKKGVRIRIKEGKRGRRRKRGRPRGTSLREKEGQGKKGIQFPLV